jgi:hypothetical protein
MKERVSYYKEIENKVYAQLEKWEKDGSNALDRLSYGEKAPKKPAPAKSSMSKVLSAAAVLVAITTSLLYAYRSVSLLNDTVTSKKIVMTLFGNDRFRRIILSTPTLIMSTASIRKITKLLSTDNTKS